MSLSMGRNGYVVCVKCMCLNEKKRGVKVTSERERERERERDRKREREGGRDTLTLKITSVYKLSCTFLSPDVQQR